MGCQVLLLTLKKVLEMVSQKINYADVLLWNIFSIIIHPYHYPCLLLLAKSLYRDNIFIKFLQRLVKQQPPKSYQL